jgi:drug/metabolite transporter (DMT)-like permease
MLLGRGAAGAPWRLAPRDYYRCALLGLLNPFSYYLVLFKSYALLPAQIAQAVNYTWAITLTLLSVPLLGHRVLRREWIALLISYAGVVIVCFGRGGLPAGALSMPGVALALGSTVLWALYWIGKTGDPLDPVVSLFLSFLFSLPFTAGACLLFSSFPALSYGWLGAVYAGLFEMGITYVLWLGALRRASSPARVSNVIFLSPFVSLLFIHYLVGERIPAATLGGLGLIVAGLMLQRRRAT